jgi:hypothetical protein
MNQTCHHYKGARHEHESEKSVGGDGDMPVVGNLYEEREVQCNKGSEPLNDEGGAK